MTQLSNPQERREVGDRLQAVRRELGLSQEQMSFTLDVALRAYRNYEQGLRELPGSLAKRLYDKFRIDPVWVYGGDDAAPRYRQEMRAETTFIAALEGVERALEEAGCAVSLAKKILLVKQVQAQLARAGAIHADELADLVRLAA